MNCRSLIEDRESIDTEIHIDGVPITAKPDRSLECTFGKSGQTKTIDVFLEVSIDLPSLVQNC